MTSSFPSHALTDRSHYSGTKGSAFSSSPKHGTLGALSDRTHKGGAIRWFLRKHAPMPTEEFEDFATPAPAKEATQKTPQANPEGQGPGAAIVPVPPMDRKPKQKQRKFLHQAMVALSTELDEGDSDINDALYMTRPIPNGALLRDTLKPRSGHQREELRKCYAAHTQEECEQLRQKVARKEAEIAGLRRQAEQMSRQLEATRAAIVNRRARKMGPGAAEAAKREAEFPTSSAYIAQRTGATLSKAMGAGDNNKNGFKKPKASSWEDRDDYAPDAQPGSQEDIQQQLSQQWEAEQAMYGSVEDQIRTLQKQTIQRRANEAGLFSKNAEILRLRAQALKTEGRVTRLANDLRRVYRQVPQVVQQKLAQSAEKFSEQTRKELEQLGTEHRMEHLKWMDAAELSQRIEVSEGQITEITARIAEAHRVLEQGDGLGREIHQKMQHLQAVLIGFEQVWARVAIDAASPRNETPKNVTVAVEAVQESSREAELIVGLILAASEQMSSGAEAGVASVEADEA